VTVPFYFAWVDEDQTTFDPSTMNVVDEAIFDMDLDHEEGQCPTLTLTIKNPRVGLLSPGRKVWAWLSYQKGLTIKPLFFGVLVGVPSDMFAELITIKLIARSPHYFELKQAAAETLKVPGMYDPIFLEETKRDDPDAILEGWSSLYHVDRTSLAVTASDILTGEDGTVVFEEIDAFYDSVKMTLDKSPLTNVQVQANVHWTQRCVGYVPGPPVNIQSYTGGSFLSDWPKPGAGLGGGWQVETSFCNDVYKVEQTPQASMSMHQTMYGDLTDYDCAVVSTSASSSLPALMSPKPLSAMLTESGHSGVCDPYSDPPTNIAAQINITGMIVPLWFLNCTWELKYSAKREFNEEIFIDVTSNTQGILTSPTVQQNTELIKISGADVGIPLIEYDAWTDFLGKSVSAGQLIFPNEPTNPGGLSYQVAINNGIAGTDEPVFSDIPGTVVTDNTVQWASLGEAPENAIDRMLFGTSYNVGAILLFQEQVFDPNLGTLVDVPGATSYYLVTAPTATTNAYTEHTYVPPVVNNDEPTPGPVTVFLELFQPTSDMLNLGTAPAFLSIPIGGTADTVTANNFFPTDRGQLAVQYLIAKARARLRMRARAVKLEWDCPFDLALDLSCRKNATLVDPRIPGGLATGKITRYSMKADSQGKLIGHVEVGCAVGNGGSVAQLTGTPEYTAGTGYMQPGYQRYDESVVLLPSGVEDIGYTPPVFAPFDDGLRFPLGGVSPGLISGSTAEQIAAIEKSFPIQRALAALTVQFPPATIPETGAGGVVSTTTGFSVAKEWFNVQRELYWHTQSTPYVMEANPVSYELLLPPVTNGPFSGAYTVTVTPLEIPQGINLEAPSSP
jgi:hypothetical protein